VFDAFDTNHDGKIGPDEMAAGLGAQINEAQTN
jgi:Ca2+-binding EF-hand superfamily protein